MMSTPGPLKNRMVVAHRPSMAALRQRAARSAAVRVVGAEAGVDGGVAEGDGEHGLADAGRADEQHVGGVVGVAARGEVAHQRRVDGGLGGEVEVLEPPGRREVREPQQAGVAAGFGGVDLDGEESFEELGVGRLGLHRRVELARGALRRRRSSLR